MPDRGGNVTRFFRAQPMNSVRRTSAIHRASRSTDAQVPLSLRKAVTRGLQEVRLRSRETKHADGAANATLVQRSPVPVQMVLKAEITKTRPSNSVIPISTGSFSTSCDSWTIVFMVASNGCNIAYTAPILTSERRFRACARRGDPEERTSDRRCYDRNCPLLRFSCGREVPPTWRWVSRVS